MLKISKLFNKNAVAQPLVDLNQQPDLDPATTLNFTGYIYKGPNGWSWDIFANNGRCVARSGHPFKRKNECRLGLQRFINKAAGTRVKE